MGNSADRRRRRQTAYMQGEMAYNNGDSEASNPYCSGSVADNEFYCSWGDGFSEASKDSRRRDEEVNVSTEDKLYALIAQAESTAMTDRDILMTFMEIMREDNEETY